MGKYNGVVGGVSAMVTDGFKSWWDGMPGTVSYERADESLTVDDAYDKVLDWQVESRQVAVNFGTPENPIWVLDPSRIAAVKEFDLPDDSSLWVPDPKKILGVHGEGYGIIQNETVADFAKALKTLGDVYVKSAGTLYDDKVVWLLVKLGEDKHFADRDEKMQRYLLISTSHDASIALQARATNVRVECMNTFDLAVGAQALVSVRHTRNAQDYLPQARATLQAAYNHYDAIDKEIEELLDVIHTEKQYKDELVPALLGDKPEKAGRKLTNWSKRRDGLIEAFKRPDQANIAGTGWGAVMAVNSYENWTQTVRGTSRPEAQARRALKAEYPLTSKARKLVRV